MIRRTLIILLAVALSANFAWAQETEMQWNEHGIGFKVPSNFKIDTNNAEQFAASNDNLVLVVSPIQDEQIEEKDLATAVLAMAKELEYDGLTAADEVEVDDFVGYYIEGKKDGANAIVMALLDKESSTNMLLILIYTDETRDQAIKIVNSFYAYD